MTNMLSVFFIFFFSFVKREEGIRLVCEAICSGIFNDLGSGSNVDVCVITKVCIQLPIKFKKQKW